jgi:ligand-binding sensor domain-containing protein
MTRKLRRFILVLGWVLLALNIGKPAYVQGPEEGWRVYTNSNHIRDLAFEGGGALGGGYTWAATFGGVVCYSANEYIKFTTLDGLAGSNVHAVAEDDGGRWWFGTGGGVSLLDDGGTPLDKDDDTWAAFTIADGLAGKSVRAISEDSEGRWWFGTWEGGVSVLDGGGTPFDKGDDTWITFAEPEGLADAYVIAIAEDGGGRLWFGTNGGGVSMLDHSRTLLDKGDDRWTTFTESNGLASNYVVAIAEDDGGRWWFGTSSDGVSLLDDGGTPFDQGDDTWTTFTESDGLARDDLMSIAKDGGGRWWFGTWGSGAGVLDDGGTPFDKGDDTWTTFATVDGLADSRIAGIVEDSEGRLWFGTWGSGVSVLDHKGTPLDKDDDTWTTFIESDGLASEHVHTIAEDSRGRWWFGMWGGVSVLDDGGTPFDKGDDTWATFTAANGLSHDWVGAIAEDSEERLWFGTENGISVLDHGGTPFDKGDDTWATFTTLDGLAHNIVLAIAEDSKGRLWFGTYEGGWSVLDHGGTPFDKGDDRWTTFTTADGLVDNGVGVIVEDSRGWFWFGTGDGVSVLDHGGTL